MSSKKATIGFVAVIIAAVMLGAGGSVTKIVYSNGVPPLFLMKIRFISATITLLLLLLCFKPQLLRIERKDIIRYALLGIVGFSGFISCAMLALKMIDVGVAVFLQYIAPAIIVLYLWLFKKERPVNTVMLAVALSILGGLFMIFGKPIVNMGALGIFFGLASAVLYAFNTVYGNKMSQKYGPYTTLFYSFLFATLFWLIMPVGSVEWSVLSNSPLWMYLYIIICYTLLPYGLIFIGICYLPPTSLSVLASLEPIVATIFAFFVIGEEMAFVQILGAVMVFSAVILLQKSK